MRIKVIYIYIYIFINYYSILLYYIIVPEVNHNIYKVLGWEICLDMEVGNIVKLVTYEFQLARNTISGKFDNSNWFLVKPTVLENHLYSMLTHIYIY